MMHVHHVHKTMPRCYHAFNRSVHSLYIATYSRAVASKLNTFACTCQLSSLDVDVELGPPLRTIQVPLGVSCATLRLCMFVLS